MWAYRVLGFTTHKFDREAGSKNNKRGEIMTSISMEKKGGGLGDHERHTKIGTTRGQGRSKKKAQTKKKDTKGKRLTHTAS